MAQQLAARLNMPNVMQTDVICEVCLRYDGRYTESSNAVCICC